LCGYFGCCFGFETLFDDRRRVIACGVRVVCGGAGTESNTGAIRFADCHGSCLHPSPLGTKYEDKADAAIALLSSSALAIGYLAGSLSSGFTADINNYMFGSITTASKTDLYMIVPLAAIIIICFIVFYNRIFAVTFDESFAKATGMHTRFYNILLSIFTAIVVVIGMRIMGSLLISSLIIFPALTSMRVFNNFKKVIVSSMFISVFCFLVAFFAFSQYSSAASIVIVNLLVFILFTFIGMLIRRFGSRGI